MEAFFNCDLLPSLELSAKPLPIRRGFSAILASKPGSETTTGQDQVGELRKGKTRIRVKRAFSPERKLLEQEQMGVPSTGGGNRSKAGPPGPGSHQRCPWHCTEFTLTSLCCSSLCRRPGGCQNPNPKCFFQDTVKAWRGISAGGLSGRFPLGLCYCKVIVPLPTGPASANLAFQDVQLEKALGTEGAEFLSKENSSSAKASALEP